MSDNLMNREYQEYQKEFTKFFNQNYHVHRSHKLSVPGVCREWFCLQAGGKEKVDTIMDRHVENIIDLVRKEHIPRTPRTPMNFNLKPLQDVLSKLCTNYVIIIWEHNGMDFEESDMYVEKDLRRSKICYLTHQYDILDDLSFHERVDFLECMLGYNKIVLDYAGKKFLNMSAIELPFFVMPNNNVYSYMYIYNVSNEPRNDDYDAVLTTALSQAETATFGEFVMYA